MWLDSRRSLADCCRMRPTFTLVVAMTISLFREQSPVPPNYPRPWRWRKPAIVICPVAWFQFSIAGFRHRQGLG